jgi:hypothetical protein
MDREALLERALPGEKVIVINMRIEKIRTRDFVIRVVWGEAAAPKTLMDALDSGCLQ